MVCIRKRQQNAVKVDSDLQDFCHYKTEQSLTHPWPNHMPWHQDRVFVSTRTQDCGKITIESMARESDQLFHPKANAALKQNILNNVKDAKRRKIKQQRVVDGHGQGLH